VTTSLQGTPPSADDLKWLELMDAARKDSLRSIEDAAKQLIGLDGIISGIYYGAVTFSKLPPAALAGTNRVVFAAPVALWLVSLVAAVLVLMPRAYAYNPHSPDEARDAYTRIVATKDTRLKIALWLFVASIIALLVALWQYLAILAA
jgi:hypothetical protein